MKSILVVYLIQFARIQCFIGYRIIEKYLDFEIITIIHIDNVVESLVEELVCNAEGEVTHVDVVDGTTLSVVQIQGV